MTLSRVFIRSVFRSPRAYIGLFFNIMIAVAMIFAYGTLFFHPDAVLTGQTKAFAYIFSVLVIAAFFALFYSVGALYKERETQFGLFWLMGITRRQLQWLIGCETAVVGLTSIGCGLFLGVGLAWGLFYLMRRLTDLAQLTMYFSWEAFAFAVGAFGAILLLIGLVAPYLIRERRILFLLKGEQRPKPIPYASPLLAILSLLSLAGIVGICFWGEILKTHYNLPICLGLSLVGIYFFYSQGSVAIAKRVRFNRALAWRGSRILWISGLAHRLRDNARLFYFLTITIMLGWGATGAAFTAHSLVSSLAEKMRGDLFQVTYTAPPAEGPRTETPPNQVLLEQRLATDLGVASPQRTDFMELRKYAKKGGPDGHATFMGIAEYQKLQPTIGGPALTVGPRDLVLLRHETVFDNLGGDDETANEAPPPPRPGPADLLGVKPAKQTTYQIEKTSPLPPQLWVAGPTLIEEFRAKVKAADKKLVVLEERTGYRFSTKELGGAQLKKAGALRSEFYDRLEKRAPQNLGISGPMVAEDIEVPFADRAMLGWVGALGLLAALLTATIFIVIANNFLIFRMYTDVRVQSKQFRGLGRMGVTLAELRRALTIQMATFFFLPLVLAIGLAACSLHYLGRMIAMLPQQLTSGGNSLGAALMLTAVLVALEIGLFLLARHQMLRTLTTKDIH